jgi:hypothetical protein
MSLYRGARAAARVTVAETNLRRVAIGLELYFRKRRWTSILRAARYNRPFSRARRVAWRNLGRPMATEETAGMIRRLMLSRNGSGVREVARRHALSKADLEAIVRRILKEQRSVGTEDRIGQRYDIRTGRHLTLEEWAAQLLRG